MITKREFDAIECLLTTAKVDVNVYSTELSQLESDGCVKHIENRYGDSNHYELRFWVTQTRKRAYEEYRTFIQNMKFSEEANLLSKESNCISKKSKTLSIISIVLAAIAIVVAIADIVIARFF